MSDDSTEKIHERMLSELGLSSGWNSTHPMARGTRQNLKVSIGSSLFILYPFRSRPLASHNIFLSFDSLGKGKVEAYEQGLSRLEDNHDRRWRSSAVVREFPWLGKGNKDVKGVGLALRVNPARGMRLHGGQCGAVLQWLPSNESHSTAKTCHF